MRENEFMEMADVKDLLAQGFTPEQIVSLSNGLKAQPVTQTEPKSEPVVEPKKNDEEIIKLQSEIAELKKTIQASNLLNDTIQSLPPKEDPSDILAKVLYGDDPNQKGNNK